MLTTLKSGWPFAGSPFARKLDDCAHGVCPGLLAALRVQCAIPAVMCETFDAHGSSSCGRPPLAIDDRHWSLLLLVRAVALATSAKVSAAFLGRAEQGNGFGEDLRTGRNLRGDFLNFLGYFLQIPWGFPVLPPECHQRMGAFGPRRRSTFPPSVTFRENEIFPRTAGARIDHGKTPIWPKASRILAATVALSWLRRGIHPRPHDQRNSLATLFGHRVDVAENSYQFLMNSG